MLEIDLADAIWFIHKETCIPVEIIEAVLFAETYYMVQNGLAEVCHGEKRN